MRKKPGRPPKKLELPKWFNLKKYSDANKLDTSGWYEQLHCRMMLIQLLRIIPNHSSPHWIKQANEAITLVRENPIIDITSSALLRAYFYTTPDQPLAALKENRPIDCLGIYVTQPTIGSICSMASTVTKEKREHAIKHFQECASNTTGGFYQQKHPSQSWFNEPLMADTTDNPTIQIDLNLTDEVLINIFPNLLKQLRKKSNTRQSGLSRRAVSTDELIKLAVLPYLDLEAWGAETKTIIPDRIMADAIFPQGTRSEDDVRTTKIRAYNLLRSCNLNNIAAQAAAEALFTPKKK